MPISLRATVVNLAMDMPRASDVLLLDTNVLYWVCYSKALDFAQEQRQDHKATTYSRYLNRALAAGTKFTKCIASLAELAHVIERDECAIFSRRTGVEIRLKDYRYDSSERAHVVDEIQTAWAMAEAITDRRSLPIPAEVEPLRATLSVAAVDGYDLLIYHAALGAGIRQILTDDVDYGEFPNVQIFTANQRLINIAHEQGKLVQR